ncbi:type II toxin-antitoxin system RatA family toxin [Actinomadura sp. 9N215]|uniref:type II toxin-antitoxin system RatA family toxin n=1 Tax=Actinomadura sp. 9N215 TaxID=3375150 RepID=UPI00378C63C5
MPQVQVELSIAADVDAVWQAVHAVEAYPRYMESVRSVEVVADDGTSRTTAWSVLLKGSVLEWTEAERVDEKRRRIEFNQLDGDLDRFDGHWQVTSEPGGGTRVELDIAFEIGIPLLAQMLDPVAVRAIRDNSVQMLRGLERRAVTG